MGGTVSRVDVERGERVVGTSQMSGTELCRIADFSRMEVAVEVGESDIVRIVPGDTATVEIDAYPRRRFRGFVSQTANSAKNMDLRFEQVTNFAVRIELLPDTVKFLPGMSAAVSIMTRRRNGCLTVPVEAVFTRNREEFIWNSGTEARISFERLCDITLLPPEEEGQEGLLPAPGQDIVFDNITFSYPGACELFHDFTLRLGPGGLYGRCRYRLRS